MKLHKDPLTPEEERAICNECNGFCCNYYFMNPAENKESWELHKFRGRKFIKYGNIDSMIMEDHCPYSDGENHTCTRYKDEGFPPLCLKFPERYRPFWNLKCKLMRVRYARGMIPKDVIGFSHIKKSVKPKSNPMKFFKPKEK